MNARPLIFRTVALGIVLGMITNFSFAGNVYILRGIVYNRGKVPVPGCTVYFVSGGYKSVPAITNSDGSFELDTPTLADDDLPFLEVQFGQRPVFRQQIPIDVLKKMAFGLQEIELPPIYLSEWSPNAPWIGH